MMMIIIFLTVLGLACDGGDDDGDVDGDPGDGGWYGDGDG